MDITDKHLTELAGLLAVVPEPADHPCHDKDFALPLDEMQVPGADDWRRDHMRTYLSAHYPPLSSTSLTRRSPVSHKTEVEEFYVS